MIVAKTKSKPVDVAAAMRQGDTDIIAEARAKFDADLSAYRRGIRRAAESGGALPADEAGVFLQAVRSLGIPEQRLREDIVAIQNHAMLTADIAAIEARNVERHAPLPGLQADFERETAAWLAEKADCDSRLKAAEAKLNAARKALAVVQGMRLESSERKQQELIAVEDRAWHLFKPVDPGQLQRIVSPESRHPLRFA